MLSEKADIELHAKDLQNRIETANSELEALDNQERDELKYRKKLEAYLREVDKRIDRIKEKKSFVEDRVSSMATDLDLLMDEQNEKDKEMTLKRLEFTMAERKMISKDNSISKKTSRQ